jgi:hypothetical protein
VARKAGGISPKREPSGRLSRATETLIDAAPPAAAKRLHQAAVQRVGDPLYATETGRLALAGQLTPTQLECARRWGRLVAEYYRATGAPLPYPPAPGGIRAHAEDDPPVTTPAGKALRDERTRIKAEMYAAGHALGEAGPDAARAVRACCEANEVAVGHVGLINLRAGLDRLARHWRLSR